MPLADRFAIRKNKPWFILCRMLAGDDRDDALIDYASLDDTTWMAILELANQQYVVCCLAEEICGRRGVPDDIQEYLQTLYMANKVRNEKISRQCREIACTVKKQKIVLLKGVTWLFDKRVDGSNRMMLDIDLLVERDRVSEIEQSLINAGYRPYEDFDEPGHIHRPPLIHPERNAAAELHIDLCFWPKMLEAKAMLADAQPLADGLWQPSPQHRLLHNIIHAQKMNGDWLGGIFSLRDALDIKWLVADHFENGIDWQELANHARTHGIFHLVAGALYCCHKFLGAPLPKPFQNSFRARLHAHRCALQQSIPGGRYVELLGPLGRALAWQRDAYGLSASGTATLSRVTARRLSRMKKRIIATLK